MRDTAPPAGLSEDRRERGYAKLKGELGEEELLPEEEIKDRNTVEEIALKKQEQKDLIAQLRRIATRVLYNAVVGSANVQIKLNKIEKEREYPISWADVSRNSGGEGFLSAFVVLSALMYYARREETDLFSEKNESKVLIMDNPFATTNASHLLIPMMEVAKKSNVQLICLTGLGGNSIYDRFNNIYTMELVSSNLRGGMQYLKSRHVRGSDEKTMLTARVEVLEQLSFFTEEDGD